MKQNQNPKKHKVHTAQKSYTGSGHKKRAEHNRHTDNKTKL